MAPGYMLVQLVSYLLATPPGRQWREPQGLLKRRASRRCRVCATSRWARTRADRCAYQPATAVSWVRFAPVREREQEREGVGGWGDAGLTGGRERTYTGIRPTHGRVSMEGSRPLAPSFDTGGWFAKDAATLQVCALSSPQASTKPRRRHVVHIFLETERVARPDVAHVAPAKRAVRVSAVGLLLAALLRRQRSLAGP